MIISIRKAYVKPYNYALILYLRKEYLISYNRMQKSFIKKLLKKCKYNCIIDVIPEPIVIKYSETSWLVGWLVGFCGISTIIGYLTPNPFLCK